MLRRKDAKAQRRKGAKGVENALGWQMCDEWLCQRWSRKRGACDAGWAEARAMDCRPVDGGCGGRVLRPYGGVINVALAQDGVYNGRVLGKFPV
ncbi:hypothetical protein A9Q02_08575 [Candidatus Chloroploca asiatica]|uniref:Uncharacterized protein n=1 Tax=Candidatus Chloroploca asiatica TaxID=1506545 RepID=A0A2H3L2W2_9CHLR|nr:hypothetical protein A9Q02_08575 [Candidatus Chloroploca asiatica]